MAKDYYSILGVNKTSSSDEIKKAYRKLAHEYHPDRNNGDEQCEQKFKEISEAYSVLSNPTKKEQYDNPSSGSVFPDFFNDVFNIHFNYGKKQTRQSKYPPDIQTTLNISLEQAYNGMSLEISFDRYNACHACNGIGGNLAVCKDCSGSGVIERGNSVFRIRNTCPNCGGTGQNITSSCPNCNNGFNIENKIVAINIPRGCDNNVVIKIHNEGNLTINSKSRGNVFLHIKIQNHDKFTVSDGNLCSNISIPFSVACLGGIIPFQHISGEILDIDVKSGTQNGELIRVINKGMPKLHHPGQYDDLLLMAQINVPTQLNEQQRIVIQQLLQNNL